MKLETFLLFIAAVITLLLIAFAVVCFVVYFKARKANKERIARFEAARSLKEKMEAEVGGFIDDGFRRMNPPHGGSSVR